MTPRLRAITDRAVAEMRETASLAEVAGLLGVSRARVSQMATGKHGANRPVPSVIYAVRVVGDTDWYGRPDALPDGQYFETRWHPVTGKGNRFDGADLEIRYGTVEDHMLPAMQAWTLVDGRPLRPSAELTELLATPGVQC